MQNFANAILHGEALIGPGYEGIHSLTISNAAFLSDWTKQEVTLPMDEDLFYKLLQEKIAASGKDANLESSQIENFDGVYNVRWRKM